MSNGEVHRAASLVIVSLRIVVFWIEWYSNGLSEPKGGLGPALYILVTALVALNVVFFHFLWLLRFTLAGRVIQF